MKFIISSGVLQKSLSSISGVLISNPVVPILENFLLELDKGKLTASASDLQISMTTSINVDTDEPGKIAIPAKILLDTLKNLPEQPISFSVNTEDSMTEITSINCWDCSSWAGTINGFLNLVSISNNGLRLPISNPINISSKPSPF
ncbi:MAG: hypothetical protein EAZ31_01345, partial [Cytophagia bacterium]